MDANAKVKVELTVGEWQAQLGLLQSATTLALMAFGKALNQAVHEQVPLPGADSPDPTS